MIDIAHDYTMPITRMFNNHNVYSSHKISNRDWDVVDELLNF